MVKLYFYKWSRLPCKVVINALNSVIPDEFTPVILMMVIFSANAIYRRTACSSRNSEFAISYHGQIWSTSKAGIWSLGNGVNWP